MVLSKHLAVCFRQRFAHATAACNRFWRLMKKTFVTKIDQNIHFNIFDTGLPAKRESCMPKMKIANGLVIQCSW